MLRRRTQRSQEVRAAAEEDDAEDDEERGVVKEENVNVEGEEVAVFIRDSMTKEDLPNAQQAQQVEKVKVVLEADVLVCIGARQRGQSSTLQDARPAPTSDRGVQGKRHLIESKNKSTTSSVFNTGRQLAQMQQLLLLLMLLMLMLLLKP